MKESEIPVSKARSIIVEVKEHARIIEEINGEPVVYKANPEAVVEEKRAWDIDDDEGRDDRKDISPLLAPKDLEAQRRVREPSKRSTRSATAAESV